MVKVAWKGKAVVAGKVRLVVNSEGKGEALEWFWGMKCRNVLFPAPGGNLMSVCFVIRH